MCTRYAPRLPSGCDEQDALEVRDKTNANFCDYFRPSARAFDASQAQSGADALAKARDLFKK